MLGRTRKVLQEAFGSKVCGAGCFLRMSEGRGGVRRSAFLFVCFLSVHKFYGELGLGISEDLLSGSFLEGSSK